MATVFTGCKEAQCNLERFLNSGGVLPVGMVLTCLLCYRNGQVKEGATPENPTLEMLPVNRVVISLRQRIKAQLS